MNNNINPFQSYDNVYIEDKSVDTITIKKSDFRPLVEEILQLKYGEQYTISSKSFDELWLWLVEKIVCFTSFETDRDELTIEKIQSIISSNVEEVIDYSKDGGIDKNDSMILEGYNE
tara:strand:- start:96 stop:446 length:351 start_codon:yes stop_codon:yes gene_type:complete